jgi:hypothetical protein
MENPVKIVSRPTLEIKVTRGDTLETNSDVQVWVNDFLFVSIHYDWRFTSNAHQWDLGEQIAGALRKAVKEHPGVS